MMDPYGHHRLVREFPTEYTRTSRWVQDNHHDSSLGAKQFARPHHSSDSFNQYSSSSSSSRSYAQGGYLPTKDPYATLPRGATVYRYTPPQGREGYNIPPSQPQHGRTFSLPVEIVVDRGQSARSPPGFFPEDGRSRVPVPPGPEVYDNPPRPPSRQSDFSSVSDTFDPRPTPRSSPIDVYDLRTRGQFSSASSDVYDPRQLSPRGQRGLSSSDVFHHDSRHYASRAQHASSSSDVFDGRHRGQFYPSSVSEVGAYPPYRPPGSQPRGERFESASEVFGPVSSRAPGRQGNAGFSTMPRPSGRSLSVSYLEYRPANDPAHTAVMTTCVPQVSSELSNETLNRPQSSRQQTLVTQPGPRAMSTLRDMISRSQDRPVTDDMLVLDLTYITERIISMSFPAEGHDTTYRFNLKDVTRMLKTKHGEHYLILNLSEKRQDLAKLNARIKEFGWPDHLAPPLERLCSICKAMDAWLNAHPVHVVALHCKGGRGRIANVIAAFMHYSNICASADQALDRFAMKRFYDDKLGGLSHPSQKRYVHYFAGLLSGAIKINSSPLYLHHILIHGVPNFDTRGGCRPFIKVYQGMQPIFTSGVYNVTDNMQKVCISISPGIPLRGDILIKCYNKRSRAGNREVIWRCQFHTCAISDYNLVFSKQELDDAIHDPRFPENGKVEFVFGPKSEGVVAVSGFKSDVTVPVDDGEEGLVRSDSYENFNQVVEGYIDTDINENGVDISRVRITNSAQTQQGPVDGSLYATVSKRRLDVHNGGNTLPNGSLSSSGYGSHGAEQRTLERRGDTVDHTRLEELERSLQAASDSIRASSHRPPNSGYSTSEETVLRTERHFSEHHTSSHSQDAVSSSRPAAVTSPVSPRPASPVWDNVGSHVYSQLQKTEVVVPPPRQVREVEEDRIMLRPIGPGVQTLEPESHTGTLGRPATPGFPTAPATPPFPVSPRTPYYNTGGGSHVTSPTGTLSHQQTMQYQQHHVSSQHHSTQQQQQQQHSYGGQQHSYGGQHSYGQDGSLHIDTSPKMLAGTMPRSPGSAGSPPSPSSLHTLRQTLSAAHHMATQPGALSPGPHSLTGQSSPSVYFGLSRRGSLSSLADVDMVHSSARFVKDTSKYWYKPNITREEAIALLKDRVPGTFIIRDSNSFPGAYGLALKVAQLPPNVQSKSGDPLADLVRHFLIEPTPKGVRLRGCSNEPVFGSLAALVYQHTITPLALPCKLLLPDPESLGEMLSPESPRSGEVPSSAAALLAQGAACNVVYLNSVDTESLTGPQAVARAIKLTFDSLALRQTTVVHFKVSNQGITLTDNNRTLFFRRHYPVAAVTYCGMDPEDRKWKRETDVPGVHIEAKIFGFVARKQGGVTDNTCHVFAELDPEQPATAIVNFVTKVMIGQSKVKS